MQQIKIWNAFKLVLRGKLTGLNSYIRKEEWPQINYISFYFKNIEREEYTKPIVIRRKKTVKIRAKINEIENKKQKNQ